MIKKDAVTRKDDLRIGQPLWVKTPNSTVKPTRHLTRDRFDVIVVGAGISGALMAEALTRQGKSVLILDRRKPVRGSTPASTAMIQHEIDVPLVHLRRKIGNDHAGRAWLRSARAVNDLVALARDLKIDCSMQPKPALYLSGDELVPSAMAREARLRQDNGLEVNYLQRREVMDRFGIDRAAALLSPASASANPAQLAAGLLQVALGRGALIVSPVEITDMGELPCGVALATRDGAVLTAEHAVFCTGYECLPQMQSPSHKVTSTWALATKPLAKLPDWLRDTIVWEASDPYLYFRSDEAGRMIIGGEDEASGTSNSDPKKLQQKAKRITAKFQDLTGLKIGKPAYLWAAPFSATKDGLPIIDRVPGHDRVFGVMGFGGNGITFSVIAAQIVAAAIKGKSDPDADIFRFR